MNKGYISLNRPTLNELSFLDKNYDCAKYMRFLIHTYSNWVI